MEDDPGSEEDHMRNHLHLHDEVVDVVVIVMMFIDLQFHDLDLDLDHLFELDHIHDHDRLREEGVIGQRVLDNVVDGVPAIVVMTIVVVVGGRLVRIGVVVVIGIKRYAITMTAVGEWCGNMYFTKFQSRYHSFFSMHRA